MRPGNQRIEFVDMSNQTSDQLNELDGMELLTSESRKIFLKWCSKIEVAKRMRKL